MSKGFILGSGPSFNQNEILKLSKNGSNVLIAANFNKLFILLEPDYIVFYDVYVWKTYWKELIQLKNSKKLLPENLSIQKQVLNYDNFYIFKRGNCNLLISENFNEGISLKNNCGVVCLRIAYLLNLNPIYLFGIDLNNNTHFHAEYDRKRENLTSLKRVNEFYEIFRDTILAIKKVKPEINIYSCSKTSRLNDIIKYKDVTEI